MTKSVENTCREMIIDRGYSSIEEVEDRIIGTNNEGETITVIFLKDAKVGVGIVEHISHMIHSEELKNIILVLNTTPTIQAKKALEELTKLIKISHFIRSDLAYNKTKNILVPKVEKLSPREIKNLPYKSNTLPEVRQDDPIAKYYGLVPGDIVRVSPKNEFQNQTIYYAMVKPRNLKEK